MRTILNLVSRNMKVFLRDKMSVFFSLLSPLIVFLLYILFLRNLQADSAMDILSSVLGEDGFSKLHVNLFVDGWLISGVLGTASITVSLGAMQAMVDDKKNKVFTDILVTPVKNYKINLSYLISFITVGFGICMILLLATVLYLQIVYGQTLAVLNVIKVIGLVLLSCTSSSLILMAVSGFINSPGAFAGFSAILGTVIGFLVGAYMPLSIFPSAMQSVAAFLPATHITSLLRNEFCFDFITQIVVNPPEQLVSALQINYGLQIEFIGTVVSYGGMVAVALLSLPVFALVNLLCVKFKKLK